MSQELVALDPPPELREHVAACVRWSESNAIATPDQYQATADHLKELKTAQKKADEFFDPLVSQAFQLHKSICARKKLLTAPLEQAERIDKAKMLSWQQAEQEKAEAERRRLQAIADEAARKEREKIEQAAAKQRAIEAEARRAADAARAKAEETANAARRKKLLEEAEANERKAAAAQAKQEVQEEKAAAVVAPVVAVAAPIPKANGINTRKTWKAKIVDLPAFLAFCCESKCFDLLLPNEKMLDGLAKSLKEMAKLPGVEFSEVVSMSASGRSA